MTVNTKRYLAAALCAVMLLEGLTGCGKKPPVKTETIAPSAAETTQPTVPATIPQDGNPGDVTCKGSYTADSVNASAVVATVGNEQLTNGQLQVYYWMEVASYRQAAHETAPDFDKPLDTQPCEIDTSVASWQQYFLKRALNSWHSALALSLQSVDEGIPTEEAYQPNMKNHEIYMSGKPATAYLYGYNKNYRLNTLHEQYLEDIPQALAALAEKYGFADVSALAKDIAGASAEDLTACMELYNRGYMYDTALSYYIAPTEEEVEAYCTEHESDYAEAGITRSSGKLVDIRHILLIPQVPEDGTGTVTVAPDGTVTCSEDLWDACLASAQTLVEDYGKALAADSRRGDNRSTNDAIFADLANKNSADAGSALDGGLYQKLHKGQLTPVLDDWCFDDARQSGDVDILRSGLGYHIVFFKGSTDIWYDAAREDLTAALGGEKIAQAREKYPAEIDYSAITLGTAAQTAPVTASDLLYPDVGHQRYPEAQLYLQQDYPTTMYGAYRIVTHGHAGDLYGRHRADAAGDVPPLRRLLLRSRHRRQSVRRRPGADGLLPEEKDLRVAGSQRRHAGGLCGGLRPDQGLLDARRTLSAAGKDVRRRCDSGTGLQHLQLRKAGRPQDRPLRLFHGGTLGDGLLDL